MRERCYAAVERNGANAVVVGQVDDHQLKSRRVNCLAGKSGLLDTGCYLREQQRETVLNCRMHIGSRKRMCRDVAAMRSATWSRLNGRSATTWKLVTLTLLQALPHCEDAAEQRVAAWRWLRIDMRVRVTCFTR